MWQIDKSCTDKERYSFEYRYFKRARDGFGALMDVLGIRDGDEILLPGYIGWSEREGSGVFDPVTARGLKPLFYHLDSQLKIWRDGLMNLIRYSKAKVMLIIHYFGFPDENAEELITAAKTRGIVVVEDCAHGLYTDIIAGGCGRWGDYALYSLHKMLPVETGGMIRTMKGKALPDSDTHSVNTSFFEYDLYGIAERRVENYRRLISLIEVGNKYIKPLYGELPCNAIPQTCPILLPLSNRDAVYEYMNGRGWGVVSLYHTMIGNLRSGGFDVEVGLSHRIMNLPVHQDSATKLYPNMIEDLMQASKHFKRTSRD